MNHTTTNPAVPDSNPYAVFRIRIATVRRRLDNLFSLSCVAVLLLIPILGVSLLYVTKSLLVWLQQTFIRWTKEDDSEKNKEWINGLVKAFEDAVAGRL